MNVVMVDRAPRRWHRPLGTTGLRRWLGGPFATRSAAPEPGADRHADLIADIVAMTGRAARDGLPLSAVLDDLRLVLHLGPTDVLPVDALRACALEWARASQSPSTMRSTVPVTLDDLEGRLWTHLGSAPGQLPGRAVVVRLRPSGPGEDLGGPRTVDVLHPADLLAAAAELVSGVFDLPDEYVALLRTSPSAAADRLVVLLPEQMEEDGTYEEDRLALCRATLASAPLTSAAPWVVEVHPLSGHPNGLLAGVREALGPD